MLTSSGKSHNDAGTITVSRSGSVSKSISTMEKLESHLMPPNEHPAGRLDAFQGNDGIDCKEGVVPIKSCRKLSVG
jgi:hypothetical protein